jgi:hypothetical protein
MTARCIVTFSTAVNFGASVERLAMPMANSAIRHAVEWENGHSHGSQRAVISWSGVRKTRSISCACYNSIVFMPLLMGLGIDYGSYFIAQSEEEQAAGKELRQALVRAFVTTGPGIAATALTTVFTFGTLLLTGLKGVAELGFVCGGGILLVLLAISFRFLTGQWVYSLCWSLVAAGLSYGWRRQLLVLLA